MGHRAINKSASVVQIATILSFNTDWIAVQFVSSLSDSKLLSDIVDFLDIVVQYTFMSDLWKAIVCLALGATSRLVRSLRMTAHR